MLSRINFFVVIVTKSHAIQTAVAAVTKLYIVLNSAPGRRQPCRSGTVFFLSYRKDKGRFGEVLLVLLLF